MSSTLYTMRNDVRSLRTARELSQQQLAEAVDVSRQTINSIEKERYTPSLPLARVLARFFGKTVEEVFHVDGRPEGTLGAVARRAAVPADILMAGWPPRPPDRPAPAGIVP